MGARIIAVLDAYVGMTSPRAYRPPIPAQVALEELEHAAGKHFRPAGRRHLRTARSREPLTLEELERQITDCRKCPRLVAWREQVAREKRAAFARRGLLGRARPRLRRSGRAHARPRPCARGARRQPHRPRVHRRPLGRLAVRRAPPGRVREPAHVDRTRRRAGARRRVHRGRRPVRAAGEQAHCRPSATTACRTRRASSSCCRVRVIVAPRRRSRGTRALRLRRARSCRRRGRGRRSATAPRSSRPVAAARLLPPEPAEHVHREADRGDDRRGP